MIGRPAVIARFPGVARSLPRMRSSLLGLPTRSRATRSPRDHDANGKPAMEMPALWKPQNGFHSALEISHTTRDFHIPTADHFVSHKKKTTRKTYDMRYVTHGATARQTATG
jgi:hypothetical protein